MDENYSQDAQRLPDSQDGFKSPVQLSDNGFKSPVQLSDNSGLSSLTTTSTPISYEVEINKSFECVFDPKGEKASEDKEKVVPVKLITTQVASEKSEVNALFSESDDFSNVSIPSPPISPECENEIDESPPTAVELKVINKLRNLIN